MLISEITDYILKAFDRVNAVESDGDLFFMHQGSDKHPFATIVTKDNEYDNHSKLSREGFYRLNIGLDKETFKPLFGALTDEKGFEAYLNLGIDFAVADTLLPHPTYGTMYWVCVVNPSKTTFEQSLKNYLEVFYIRTEKKHQP